LSVQSPQQLKT